jgi:hypothetical protein
MDCQFFPFSIALAFKENEGPEGPDSVGRVELVATSYDVMREWVNGINTLVNTSKFAKQKEKMQQLLQNF